MSSLNKTLFSLSLLAVASSASAGIVTNDTELLSGAGHEQLATWLGEDVDLTRIFAKGISGNTSQDWHAHVDNRGRTFTLLEVFNGEERRVIGGYNEFDWASAGGYVTSSNRNNFLFNLTNGALFRKNANTTHQTHNRSDFGPTFGAGYDLHLNQALSGGYTNIGHSYTDPSNIGTSAHRASFAGSYDSWTVDRLETFTLHASSGTFGSGAKSMTNEQGSVVSPSANEVSVPFGLGGLALSLIAFGVRRRT